MKLFSNRAKRRKKQQMDALLASLLEAPDMYLSAEALAETSGLGAAVLPLLAKLHERGLVEPQWTKTLSGPTLAYRLSATGRAQAAPPALPERKVTSKRTSTVKPLFARLSALLSRTDVR